MLRYLILYTILLCASFPIEAQQKSMDTIKVKVIAQEQGLSQLNALTLDFDTLGYLWIGTENGLNRYNGHEMKVYKVGNKPKNIPDDHIRAMYQSNDTLWLASNTNSVCAYLHKEDRFISFEDKLNFEKFPSLKFAYTLTPINKRYLLAGTINYCVLIDRKTLEFKTFSIDSKFDNEYITSIIPFKEDSFLMSTNYKRTYVFDFKNRNLFPFKIKNKAIQTLLKLDLKRILIAAEDGLFVYELHTGKLQPINIPILKAEVTALFRWDKKHILVTVANRNYLINDKFQYKELAFLGDHGKTMQMPICSIVKDAQGGFWIGTKGRGVFYYHPYQKKFVPSRISTANSPKTDFISIFNFLKERDTLWLATEFGVARYLNSSKKYKLYLTNNLDYTLAKDSSGTLWAGGFGEGLLKYNRAKDVFDRIYLPITDDDVIHITPISKDSIWIHTWSEGIYAYNTESHKIKKKTFNGESLIRSRNSLIDSSGDIWLASDNGLYQILQNGKTIYYDSLTNERVFAIAEGLEKNIWVGTAKGLNKINKKTGTIEHYLQQEGLPNDFIYGLESDRKGHIWMSTNYGLSQFNPKTKTFKNYTEQDGLQNNEFNGKASYKDLSGNLYFGGMNGFNKIDIDSIPVNKIPGNTIIENIQLFGKSIAANIPYKDTLNLSHKQNVITFNFVNLNYLWPDKNHFRFMLEGFDKDWRPVTQERSSTYTNLNPGIYTFKVQGSNNEMLWGNTDNFIIIINTPWFQALWFKILVGLLIFLSAFGFILYRHEQQKRTNKKLSLLVAERTNSLTKTNKVLKASLELTKKQKENISYLMQELNHRVKNNLQLMTSLIDFQSINSKDIAQKRQLKQLQFRIFTLAKIHDSLNHKDDAIKQIHLDKFIHQLALDIISFSGFYIKLETQLLPLIFPNNKLTYIGLIVNELITNSIKHAFTKNHQTPQISILLRKENEQLIFEYRDNGTGFSELDLNATDSMGIKLIHLLTEELGMELSIQSNGGSSFIFTKKLKIPS